MKISILRAPELFGSSGVVAVSTCGHVELGPSSNKSHDSIAFWPQAKEEARSKKSAKVGERIFMTLISKIITCNLHKTKQKTKRHFMPSFLSKALRGSL